MNTLNNVHFLAAPRPEHLAWGRTGRLNIGLVGALIAGLMLPVGSFANERSTEEVRLLLGTDTNNNGLRDEIEERVQSEFIEPPQRAAVLQLAAALQQTLLVEPTDMNEVRAASRQTTLAITCVYARFPSNAPAVHHPARIVAEMERMTIDTRTRKKAYRAYSRALSGTVSSLPQENGCTS